MNSKLEARAEAARLAAAVDGITPAEIIPLAHDIASFILGGTDLPEVADPMEMYKGLIEKMKLQNSTDVSQTALQDECTDTPGQKAQEP